MKSLLELDRNFLFYDFNKSHGQVFFILVNFRQRMYYMPFIATMVHFPNQKENQGPSSIKRIERLNLDGFEKLLASVIQKGSKTTRTFEHR